MPERVTADVQLQRILYIFAAASREDGATLAELAHALGTEEGAVLRDIQEVMTRSYYHPAGYPEGIGIYVEGDRVHVWSAEEVRPVRLSPTETLALGLGLRLLAAEAEGERKTAILALATTLETSLAAPDHAASDDYLPLRKKIRSAPSLADLGSTSIVQERVPPYNDDDAVERDVREAATRYAAELAGHAIATGEDEIRALLADAARDRVHCRIQYAKPGDDSPSERSIAPYLLVYAEGRWYALAHDDLRNAVRVFRLDRILRVERTREPFEVPADFDASAYIRDGRVYHADGDVSVRVRYSARIAGWLLERRIANAEPWPDGGIVVRHDVADSGWLVRHVLQYGPDAEVLDPPELRNAIAETLTRMV